MVLALRQMRLPGFQTAKYGGLSRATVSRILTRHGLAKLSDLDPPPPAIRHQHLQPWLHRYNWHRPHTAPKFQTRIQSLDLPMNNVLRLHSSNC